jgi:hypothetical protein
LPIGRTYYTVIRAAMVLEDYRDDIAGEWYLQRVIDRPGGTVFAASLQ